MDRFDVCASQRQPRGISATFTTAFIFDVGVLEAEEGRTISEALAFPGGVGGAGTIHGHHSTLL